MTSRCLGEGAALTTYPSKLSPTKFFSSRPGGAAAPTALPWLRPWKGAMT